MAFRTISSLYNQNKINEKKITQQTIGNALNGVFTKTQQLALISTKRVNWTSKVIVKALSLRGPSKKAYVVVRNEMKILLPSMSTLKRWVSDMTFSRGLLKELFFLLSNSAKILTWFEKLCVLLIDEIDTDGKIT